MKKKFNSIEFVDSLAEVTRHFDREVIERSLLQTLSDFTPSAEYRIYRILPNTDSITLALIAFAKNNIVDTLGNEVIDTSLPDDFFPSISTALETQTVQIINTPDVNGKIHIIYPAITRNNENFAILIQSSFELNFESQRLVHALLKVYANYMALIDKARRDKLTQLLNRETLDAEITRILIRNTTSDDIILKQVNCDPTDSRHTLNKNNYWLGILDIDFFKKINDVYGHLYGDEILILVARLLQESIRDCDFAFRYGGEEFVIILISDGYDIALLAFERIRIVINKHPYAKVDDLSVSIGVTQITNQISPSSIIEEADKALYYAKEHGRNQTQFYSDLIEKHLIEETIDDAESGEADFF